MSSARVADAEALLQKMLQDMEHAPAPFQPTQFWRNCNAAILRDIELFGLENFYAHPSAQTIYAARTDSARAAQDLATVQHHAPALADYSQSLVGGPVDLYEQGGHRYSSTALSYLRGLAFLEEIVDTSATETVLEIGGGFGVLGDILVQKGIFYLDVDIPPLAAVATYYLKCLLGDDAVLDYRTTESLDLGYIRHRYRAAVLCPWQLPKVTGAVDLAVNYVSFQEMEPPVVANYAREIQRLQARHLLLRNTQAGKVGVQEPTTREHYLELFSNYRLLAADAKTFGEIHPIEVSEVLLFGPTDSRST